MAKTITKWKSNNKELYDKEIDALRADASYWKDKAEKAENQIKSLTRRYVDTGPVSSYGSSGGGGHD